MAHGCSAAASNKVVAALMAKRIPDHRLRSSVRFSLGAPTTEVEIDEAIARIVQVVGRIEHAQHEG